MTQKLSPTAKRAKAIRDKKAAMTTDRKNKKAENQRKRRAAVKAGKNIKKEKKEKNQVKDRKALYKRISKIFIRVSSELGLYHRNGANRPLYSIRHTFISGRYNANAPLEVVARSSNTSVKIVKKSYLDNEDTMM